MSLGVARQCERTTPKQSGSNSSHRKGLDTKTVVCALTTQAHIMIPTTSLPSFVPLALTLPGRPTARQAGLRSVAVCWWALCALLHAAPRPRVQTTLCAVMTATSGRTLGVAVTVSTCWVSAGGLSRHSCQLCATVCATVCATHSQWESLSGPVDWSWEVAHIHDQGVCLCTLSCHYLKMTPVFLE